MQLPVSGRKPPKKMARRRLVNWLGALLALLLVLATFLVVLNLYLPTLTRNQILQQAELVEGTSVFEQWSHTSTPVYTSFYMLDVQNPDQVLEGGRPVLVEKGPYTYREYQEKEVLGWSEDLELLTYRVHKVFRFERSLSVGDESDQVTVLNVPFVTVLDGIKRKLSRVFSVPALMFIRLRFSSEKFFVTKSVGELLFSGYQDDMLSSLKYMHDKFGVPIPSYLPTDGRFRLLFNQNDTDNGEWEVYTGRNRPAQISQVRKWNEHEELSCWSGPDCNQVKGSDGMVFQPFITNDVEPQVFGDFFNRSIHLSFESDESLLSISTKKFVVRKDNFANPKNNPKNQCYENQPTALNSAFDGLIDGAACNNDVPLLYSMPHFYMGSEELLEQFEGLKPNKSIHETFAQIDPVIGFTLNARKAVQVNFDMTFASQAGFFQKMNRTLFPVLWFEETGRIDQDTADLLIQKVHGKIALTEKLVASGAIFFCASSCCLFVLILLIVFVGQPRSSDEQSLVHHEQAMPTESVPTETPPSETLPTEQVPTESGLEKSDETAPMESVII